MQYIIIGVLLFQCFLSSAQYRLEGTVYLYNEKGQNQALKDVGIKATGSGSAVTKANGYYAFSFDNSIVMTHLTVTRIGYEIINQEDIRSVDLKKKKQQNIYFDLEGNTEIRKRAMLDAALKQSRKRRDQQYRILDKGGAEAEKLRAGLEKEAGRKLTDIDEARSYLYTKFGGEAEMIDKVVSSLIRMNLNHTNKEVEKIKAYTLSGNLAAALVLLDFEIAFKEIRRNNNLIHTASADNQAKKDKFLSGIPILLSNGLYSKVDSVYTLAMLVDSSDLETIFKYASFLQKQKQFTKAAELYRRFLRAPHLKSTHDRASALNNLGVLYDNINQKKEAEIHYQEALVLYRRLAISKPETYEGDVAIALNNLGSLFYDKNEDQEAFKYLEEALGIRRRLTRTQPQIYKPDLASTLNALGIMANHRQQKADAKKYFTEALEIRRSLVLQKSETYEAQLASTLNSLGVLSTSINDTKDALHYFTEALEIRKRLVKKNPDAYQVDLASTLNNLGTLSDDLNEKEASRKYFLEALEIYRTLKELHPEVYSGPLATVFNNIAVLYKSSNRKTEAKEFYLAALELRRQLAVKNPEIYAANLASTLNNLGVLATDLRQEKEAHMFLQESMVIYRQLAERNPAAYTPDIAMGNNNLGALFNEFDKKENAMEYYLAAMEIYRGLMENNPDTFGPHLANTLNNLGILSRHLKNKADAEKYYLQALALYQKASVKSPEIYQAYAAMTLNNLSLLSGAFQEKRQAITYAIQAADIYRLLVRKAPLTYRPELAKSTYQIAKLYAESGEHTHAIPLYNEALFHARIHHAHDHTYSNSLESVVADLIQTHRALNAQDSIIHYSKAHLNLILEVDPVKRNASWSIKAKSITANVAASYNSQCARDSSVKYYALALKYCDTTLQIMEPILEKSNGDATLVKFLAAYNGSASWYALHTGQILKSEAYARKAIGKNTGPHPAQTNLAHALLLQHRYREAWEIYSVLKSQPYPIDSIKTYGAVLLDDFERLACSGVIPGKHLAELERVKVMLKR